MHGFTLCPLRRTDTSDTFFQGCVDERTASPRRDEHTLGSTAGSRCGCCSCCSIGDELQAVPDMLAVKDTPLPAGIAVDDDLVSDDELALVGLSCSFCGEASAVPPELAAALVGSHTSFSCAFLRAGGCVSNLRRRKR